MSEGQIPLNILKTPNINKENYQNILLRLFKIVPNTSKVPGKMPFYKKLIATNGTTFKILSILLLWQVF